VRKGEGEGKDAERREGKGEEILKVLVKMGSLLRKRGLQSFHSEGYELGGARAGDKDAKSLLPTWGRNTGPSRGLIGLSGYAPQRSWVYEGVIGLSREILSACVPSFLSFLFPFQVVVVFDLSFPSLWRHSRLLMR
jgi:hypothetical protein